MKNALIAFVILGIAAAFSPPAKADDDYDQHYEWHHHHYHHHYHHNDQDREYDHDYDHGHQRNMGIKPLKPNWA